MAVDGNGNVYAGGGFYGTLSFGNGVTVTSVGFEDAYVVKLDSSGNALWARDMGGGPFSGSATYINSVTNGVPLFSFPEPFLSSAVAPGGTQNVQGKDPAAGFVVLLAGQETRIVPGQPPAPPAPQGTFSLSGGLTEPECVSLVALIKEVRASGASIIWIEHVVHALLAAVDRLVVLHNGGFIAQGHPQEVIRSATVAEIYMGIAADA